MSSVASEEVPSWHSYRLSWLDLYSSAPLPELQDFATSSPHLPERKSELTDLPASSGREAQIFDAAGFLVGGLRHVRCELQSWGFRIEVEECGTIWLTASGREVHFRPAQDLGAEARAEVLLGPGLILALALRGVYCLHASAVLCDGRVAALIGESGRGKSTLARQLAGLREFQAVADDVLPLRFGSAPEVSPWFPQLKLSADAQPGRRLPEGLPLAAAFVLEGGADCTDLELVRLSPRRAAEALIRHTVAARLFSPRQLAEHFESFSNLAAGLPVFSLRYPWNPSALGAVSELFRRGLEASPTLATASAAPRESSSDTVSSCSSRPWSPS